jgi:hypothetical protein
MFGYETKATRRKTIYVKGLREYINKKLKVATITQEQKNALCNLLEVVLHNTKNYNGYYFNGYTTGLTEEEKKQFFDNYEYNRHYL